MSRARNPSLPKKIISHGAHKDHKEKYCCSKPTPIPKLFSHRGTEHTKIFLLFLIAIGGQPSALLSHVEHLENEIRNSQKISGCP